MLNGLVLIQHFSTLTEHSVFLYNLPHWGAFLSTIPQIHTPVDAMEGNLGLVSCPIIFDMQTGAEKDQTTNLLIY